MTAEEFVSNVKMKFLRKRLSIILKRFLIRLQEQIKNWKASKELYHSLNEEQKQQMQTFTKMVMQDVVSIIFGKLDNISSICKPRRQL